MIHDSKISHNSRVSESSRFYSINKENFISIRKQTPTKIKEDVYLNKLAKLEERYMNEIENNNRKIKELEERSMIYKNISSKQAAKLQSCETTLAKEEYLTEIMNYKDGINRVQQLLTAITEEHQNKTAQFHKDFTLQNHKINMNLHKIAQLEGQMEQNQQMLNNNIMRMKKDRDQIEKYKELIGQKQKQEQKYLEIMSKIHKKQGKQ